MKLVTPDAVKKIDVPLPIAGFENFLSVYLVKDEARGRTLLFETGPAVSIPPLLRSLDALGAKEIDYLVYTHIHLDHAGGAGDFLAAHPESKVICNRRARRHLVDPKRLWQASLDVLGDVARTYREPLPVAERALAPQGFLPDGLEEYETPGHAPHHSVFVYAFANGRRVMFAGEAAGVCFAGEKAPKQRPASPVGFKLAESLASLDRIMNVDADCIVFPHNGIFGEPRAILSRAREQLLLWKKICGSMKGASVGEIADALNERDPFIGANEARGAGEAARERMFTLQSLSGFLHDMQTNGEA